MKVTSLCLLLATISILVFRENRQILPEDTPAKSNKLRVSFSEIKIDGNVWCSVKYDESLGGEVQVFIFGQEQARMAFDYDKYWFWIRNYDREKYYLCPADSAGDTSVVPPLRPSFFKWMINDFEGCDGTFKVMDGDYEVEMELRKGMIKEQRYIIGGNTETRVKVDAFQESSGRSFPALAVVETMGRSFVVNMGRAETNNPKSPDTSPPIGLKPEEIKR